MKYIVEVGGELHEVELDGNEAVVGGERYLVALDEVAGSPVRLVRVNGATHRVLARRQPERGRYALWVDGWQHDLLALDERQRAIRELTRATASTSGPAPLAAPMPGLIVRVAVQPGDAVSAGQGLVVMEAMKMENELRATTAGTVTKVHVAPGQAVDKGAVLVELE